MSMKIRGLFHYSHDIYEKKETWLKPQVENGDGGGRQRPLWFCRFGRFNHSVES